MNAPVAFVLKGYPRLSETFIAQEILALERAGLRLSIVSLRRPTDRARHEMHRQIDAPVHYLPEYLYRAPLRVLRGWWRARRLPGYRRALAAWLRDLRRDPTPNRVRRFGQALALARELSPSVRHLHAHFLHTPASVTRYTALMRELTWSVSAHARDIWTSPDWEMREKLACCAWAVTCTAVNREHLARLAPDPARVELLYHGLEFSRLPAPPARGQLPDGRDPEHPVVILSVGRAVEKKGYDDLLAALAALPADLAWRFEHVGGGTLAAKLRRQAAALGLEARVRWHGAQPQETVMAHYARADLFVLASRVAADGDRDGLPNVLMEAQAMGVACVATRVSAIPELVHDGETGVLVPERAPQALAVALEALIRAPRRRARLGAAGQRRVRECFDAGAGVERLVRRLRASLDAAGAHPAADPGAPPAARARPGVG